MNAVMVESQNPAPGGSSLLEEQIFLIERGVLVSNSRFLVQDRLVSTPAVLAARVARGSRMPSALLGVAGLALLKLFAPVGLAALAVAVSWRLLLGSTLVLSTAEGEVKMLRARDADFLERIVAAVNRANLARR